MLKNGFVKNHFFSHIHYIFVNMYFFISTYLKVCCFFVNIYLFYFIPNPILFNDCYYEPVYQLLSSGLTELYCI